MEVSYHAPIPKGAKIFVVNHPTTTDPFVITTLTKGNAGILIKDILFDIPVFGRYLKWAGHIPVLPSRGKEAFDRAINLLKRGKSVIVFIEGQISPSGGLKCKPHTGAVRLAISSNAPIVPVGIAVDKTKIKVIKTVIKGRRDEGTWYFKGPYAFTIGKPFRVSGDLNEREKISFLTDLIMKKIDTLTLESSEKILALKKYERLSSEKPKILFSKKAQTP